MFNRVVATVVVLAILCLSFPKIIHAKQGYRFAQETASSKITQNPPEYLATPEKQIPLEEEKSYLTTILAVLGGVIVVGGLAALLAGGGGGGGGSDPGDSGSVSVSW